MSVILIFLCLKKSYRFPTLCIIFLALNIFVVVGDFFLANTIPAVAAEENTAVLKEMAQVVIVAIVWIPYFLVSKRVKNTFVKPELIPPLPIDGMVIPETDANDESSEYR